MCSTYDRSFHSFDELTDLLLRGGEIELLYKHTAYTIFPLFEENVITAIDVGYGRIIWRFQIRINRFSFTIGHHTPLIG